jgi:hypothetical protein
MAALLQSSWHACCILFLHQVQSAAIHESCVLQPQDMNSTDELDTEIRFFLMTRGDSCDI